MRQHAESEARTLLRKHGLAGEPLTSASGVANDVWLTPSAVIRLNGGRFRDAFRHEARVLDLLPASIPHPAVLARGEREDGGEFLILERLPGRTLDAAWPDLGPETRRYVARDLALIVKRLHALPLVSAMRNPWVQDALTVPVPGDAYHAPPASAPMLVSAAAAARPDLADLIATTGAFIEDRMTAFDLESGRPDVLVHADLHFRNVLVDVDTDADGGRITGLIDFEGSRPAAADVELDMLVRFLSSSRQFGSDESSEYEGVLGWFHEGCPELFAHPHLEARLEVYEALWHLVQVHHRRPEYISMPDPAIALRHLLIGGFHERLDMLLAPVRGRGAGKA